MPGICGIIGRDADAEAGQKLGRMLTTLRGEAWYRVESQVGDEGRWALARCWLGYVNNAPQPAMDARAEMFAVMDGELYDYDEQRRMLEAQGHQFGGDSQAELLIQGFRARGDKFFADLHGKFSAVIVDRDARKTYLVNDRFGMKPLYFAQLPGRLLFASEIKALLTEPEVSRRLNPRGIAQFFSYGQLMANDTFFESIATLPGAAYYAFDARTGQFVRDCYRRVGETTRSGRDEDLLHDVDQALGWAIDRTARASRGLGISLSGGLDSRVILAAIDHERTPITSLSLGVAGSLDHRCAERMAALTNRRHHRHVLASDFLNHFAEHMRRMVHLTDGHYLSQCIVIPTLPVYRQLGIEVLLRGHAGELMHMRKAYNFSLDREGEAIGSAGALQSWLWRHLRAYMIDRVEGRLLRAIDQHELELLARDSLADCLAESASIEPALQRVWHLFLSQRLRRETALSMVKLGSVVETRLPYLDNELVDLLLSAPPRLKLDETMQTYILRRRRPEFLRIVNANTGASVGAGEFVKRVASFRMRVLAKLGVAGYQPYERLGSWLRRELAPLVRDVLLGERCLARGVFVPETVRAIVRQHFESQRNHTFLLMAMMIFELGQREFVDGDAFGEPSSECPPHDPSTAATAVSKR